MHVRKGWGIVGLALLLAALPLVGTAQSTPATTRAAAAEGVTVFRFPVLMLATWWDADEGQTSPQFQEGDDAEHFGDILDGFGKNPRGSLTEYYYENSYGHFLVEVDVFGPYTSVRSLQDRCYYGGIDPPPDPLDDLDPLDTVIGAGGLGAVGMAIEAVPQADPEVDFSRYDNNGDGYVDFMGIIHSGADMATTGDPCNTWSHALPVSAFGDIAESTLGLPADTIRGGLPTLDGTLVDRVFTMPEFDQKGSSLNIGVAAHEMAHALGEPDYYAPNGTSSGDGDWDIMSGGSYLGNPDGSNPSWFNPATRVFQGWTTPTIVHDDLTDYTLQPREDPQPGLAADEPNPNLLLVPNRWVKVGQEDDDGHVWTDKDVRGLVKDGDLGYVVEGWYLEYASRVAGPDEPIHKDYTRSPYFDRGLHGSGLLAWHWDYWRRSNTLPGYSNDAQNDPSRMQVDVEEFDFYDDTQDIALNFHRGEASDPFPATATGLTSGTHQNNPSVPDIQGDPQGDIALQGVTTILTPSDDEFVVDDNPANYTMRVRAGGSGDCKLQLFRMVNGQRHAESDIVDSGSAGAMEEITITEPEPGQWIAEVSDFAGCTNWTGTVHFEAPGFDTKGSSDTWSDETEAPTGWAFTNIRMPGQSAGLDLGSESARTNDLTLDIVQLGSAVDVSPGYAFAAANELAGRGVVSAGAENAMSVPVFSNGGIAPGPVQVQVFEGSTSGPLVVSGTVDLGAYERKDFTFDYTPDGEGPYTLVTKVSATGDSAANNTQATTGWAGPANPSVLIVDDDGYTTGELSYAGALAALGVPYAIATTHVDAATMAAYDAVIWTASIDRGPGQLNEDDRAAIADYLSGGGRLWLASNRAIGALEAEDSTAFARHYFGAQTTTITTLNEPYTIGGTGDILGDAAVGMQPYPIRAFSDVYEIADNAFGEAAPVLKIIGSPRPGLNKDPFGVRVTGDEQHGSFKTVATPFSLSQTTTLDAAVDIARGVLDFFGVDTGAYTPRSADPLVFHTNVRFQVSGRGTPINAIVLGGTAGQPVSLFYRDHATDDFTRVAMVAGAERGTYSAMIPGTAVTPDGIDYFIKAGTNSTYDPAPAETGALAHAIAVAIPEVTATPVEPPPTTAPPTTQPGPDVHPRTGGGDGLLWISGVLIVFALVARRRAAQQYR